MKEYMLHIRNVGDGKAGMSPEQHLAFVKGCEDYIGILKKVNRLIAVAQPLIREGKVITKQKGEWVETPVNAAKEIQVGYYHIRAGKLWRDAITIAKKETRSLNMLARREY